MKLPKGITILVAGVVILFAVSLGLGYKIYFRQEKPSEKNKLPPTPTPILRDRLNSDNFKTSGYAVPIADNTLDDAELVQIRGIVEKWNGNILSIKVIDSVLNVTIPDRVEARCMAETMTDATGREYKTSEVFLDFKNAKVKGNLTRRQTLEKELPSGKDITLQAELGDSDSLRAVFIVGYGCRL